MNRRQRLRHRHRNVRRKNNKLTYFLLVLCIVLIGALFYQSGGFDVSSLKQNMNSYNSPSILNEKISIKELSQNGANYVGEELYIEGSYEYKGLGPALKDSEGYYVILGKYFSVSNSCIEYKRDYVKGKTYSAKGTMKSTNEGIVFDCSEPIK